MGKRQVLEPLDAQRAERCRDRLEMEDRRVKDQLVEAVGPSHKGITCDSAWKIDPLSGGIGVQN